MLTAMMATFALKIFVLIQILLTLTVLILTNRKEPVVEFVKNATGTAIVSIGRRVIIPANAEPVVKDAFMVSVRIMIRPVREPRPVVNAAPIIVSIALNIMMGIAVTGEFAFAVL